MAYRQKIPPLSVGSFGAYCNYAFRYPTLNKDSEFQLWRMIKESPFRLGDYARDKIVKPHLRLVVTLAHKLNPRPLTSVDMIDTVSAGNIGLLKAVRKFDMKFGCRLSTYASWHIKHEIQVYLIYTKSVIKGFTAHGVGRSAFFSLSAILAKYGIFTFTEPISKHILRKIAEELNTTPAKILILCTRLQGDYTLNSPVSDKENETRTYQDLLKSDDPSPEEQAIKQIDRKKRMDQVKDALQILSERDRYIFLSRFIYHDLDPDKPTLEELGELYDISDEAVRQIEERAMEKIRRELRLQILVEKTRNPHSVFYVQTT